MTRPTLRTWLSLGVVLALMLPSMVAKADGTTLIVLGVVSDDGDDDFARDLSGALRHAAEQVAGLNVSQRDVSLAQITMAAGCDTPDAACMARIAQTLTVQRLVYGTVHRSGAGADYDFVLSLSSFDAATGTVDHTVQDTVPHRRSDIDQLREPARRWMSVLSGQLQVGTIVVTTTAPNAIVLVDGTERGTVTGGRLAVHDVAPGEHQVEVRAPGRIGTTQSVTVAVGEEATVAVTLEAGHDEHTPPPPPPTSSGHGSEGLIVGIAAAGVGVTGMILTAVAWSQIQSVSNDRDWLDYRNAVPRPDLPGGVADICVEAKTGMSHGSGVSTMRILDLCNQASTWEPLQYVFLAAGVVGLGVGAFFIINELTEHHDTPPAATGSPTVAFAPLFLRDGGGLAASGTF